MRLDSQLLFSDNQEITESTESTNVVQLANTDNGLTEVAFGNKIPLLIQVTEAFEGCTSVSVAVETAEDEDFTDPVTLVETDDVDVDDLVQGYKFKISEVPKGNLGYMRLQYTVSGTTATAGAITAGIVDALDNSFQDMN